MPKGFFLAEVDVANPNEYEAYRTRVLPTVEKYGGRSLVRGGSPTAIEGVAFGSRVIIIEFDSPEQAMVWYNCPEYQATAPPSIGSRRAARTPRSDRRQWARVPGSKVWCAGRHVQRSHDSADQGSGEGQR